LDGGLKRTQHNQKKSGGGKLHIDYAEDYTEKEKFQGKNPQKTDFSVGTGARGKVARLQQWKERGTVLPSERMCILLVLV